jgi:hypothetical protein
MEGREVYPESEAIREALAEQQKAAIVPSLYLAPP